MTQRVLPERTRWMWMGQIVPWADRSLHEEFYLALRRLRLVS